MPGIVRLEVNPSAVTPYYNFLKEFNLLDITSNVKSLYSMTESNKEEMAENIASLINRNYTMMDKNEKISGEDKVNTVNFLIYVPMILSCFKLLMGEFFEEYGGIIISCFFIILFVLLYLYLLNFATGGG